jgi:PAS domain S-box-containing protein
VELLYTQAPAAFVGTGLNVGIAVAVLWQVVDRRVLFCWLALMLAVTLSRFVLVRHYYRGARTADRVPLWRRRFILGTGLAGTAWGSAGLLLFPPDSTVHQVFLVFILGGMAAGAIATLSADMSAFLAFFLPTLLPVTARIFTHYDSEISTAMGFLLLSFAGVLLIAARQLHASIVESLQLRLANLDLVQNLSIAKEQTEDSNLQLAESNQALNAAIMEVKANEERHRSIIETAQDAFVSIDTNGAIIEWNHQAEVTFGWTRAEIIGRSLTETIIPPQHREAHTKGVQRFLAGGAEQVLRRRLELTALHRDGREFPAEIAIWSVKLAATYTFNAFVRDISERKIIERMKDEFVAMVSHELRTPLTSMRGALGLLTSGVFGTLPEKGRRLLEIALNNTERLVRLINDILDIERMASGKVTMKYQTCDSASLMTQAAEVMQPLAEQAGVTLSVTTQSVPLWADPDRILQALTNLLSNAIKFSPSGGTVWLTVARRGKEAEFQVKDQGRGIPVEKRDAIFERFQQVDASDSRKESGTGLGLAICRSIVEQHGGRIWVESTFGEGSAFFFTVPVEQETARSETALALESHKGDTTP